MKNRLAWIVLALLLLSVFALTFMKSPEAITAMLQGVSRDMKNYSALAHIVFILVLALGLFVARIRNVLFFIFMAFLSLSATVVSMKYVIVPNIIVFAVFFVLIMHAYLKGKLSFNFRNIGSVDLLFGFTGLLFGFWYLHWVEGPILLNAMLFSPLGMVNCPTMITICGFLILSRQPRSPYLEGVVALTTLYFGFFGLFRLGAYIDITLILCALFLLIRLVSDLTREALLKKVVATK